MRRGRSSRTCDPRPRRDWGRHLRRVLILAYHFPPTGGAGVQRTLKLVRHLPELGYEAIVIAGGGEASGHWTPHDAALSADLGADLEILRPLSPEPPAALGWQARGERWLRRPSAFARWWVESSVSAGSTVRNVDLVYASMSPFESASAATRLAHIHDVPWVADLRDPWALDEMIVYPTIVHRRLERTRMRTALSSAGGVIWNTPQSRAVAEDHFPELREMHAAVVPNGFDAADFERPVPRRSDDEFRIVHTGFLHTELGRSTGRTQTWLGGRARGVDFTARSHVFLLEAIRALVAQSPGLRDRVRLHLAGALTKADRDAIAPDLAPLVVEHGYVSHSEALGLLRSGDLLFLPMHDLPAGTRATIVPGKTYEYLAAGVRILAAVPDGDARDLLSESGNVVLVRPRDVTAISTALRREIESRDEPDRVRATSPAVLERYERKVLATQIAAFFDAVAPVSRERGLAWAAP